MVKNCKLCGKAIEEEEHKERQICHSCMHKGFLKLKETLKRLRNTEDG
ncbi:MAG: hypothetical protein SVV03_06210 [Candidatus Nanohaloarchaea archaeon]|nr:hypothetical protein [Candidatus Nanohaloarchaea archaeon]